MTAEEIIPPVLFQIGPVEVTSTIPYTLVVSGLLIAGAWVARLGLDRGPVKWAIVARAVVEHFEQVLREQLGRDPRMLLPVVVTLALFIGTSNLIGVVPGMKSPTGDFSTAAALAAVVFLAVPFYGIRTKGFKGYFQHYLEPTPLLLPIEIVSELSRTVSLAVRLFGNVISEKLVVAVLLGIAGFLIPVPLIMLGILISLVQAYVFAILSAVYLSAAVRMKEPRIAHG